LINSRFVLILAVTGAAILAACSGDAPETSDAPQATESENAMDSAKQPGRLVFRVKGMKKTKSGAT